MALNLEKQLVFYGSYHHESVNVAIHIICVPLILLTGLLFACNTPNLDVPLALQVPNLPINLGTVAAFSYSALYILMEPVAGVLLAPLIVGGTAYSNYLLATYPKLDVNQWALAIHVVGWIAQFIGHGKFEGRAPALLDNLVQALFLAPFFVWFEILFHLGYRPQLKARLNKAIEVEIKKFKSSEQKRANGTVKKAS